MDLSMTDSALRDRLESRLGPHNQLQLLQFWDELPTNGRARLAQQIEQIDFGLIASLFRGKVDQPDWADLARRAEPPSAVRLTAADDLSAQTASDEAIVRGTEAVAAGQIGVLLVAGGQGSRLGFEKPKSLYPIGPLSGASLLQIHIEKVRALAKRFDRPMPLYLMTSPPTHDATVEFLATHDNFGLPADDLLVFCQGTMPAVDAETGQLLLADKDQLFLSPDGHGGTVAALAASGAIQDMERRGVEHLFYFQVDNPLAPVCDPRLVGAHLLGESELTSLAVAKESPDEKLGNFVTIDGRQQVIEYSDFPQEIARERDATGQLRFWAGSVAIHVFDVQFLKNSLEMSDSLPFHIARKKVGHIDGHGNPVVPEQPNALKFERFIFDLLPQARRPLVVEYPELEVFAPLKNASGAPKDTPEYVRRLMLDLHRKWLINAGARFADQVQVEISPLFALDAQGVAHQIKPGREFSESEYLH